MTTPAPAPAPASSEIAPLVTHIYTADPSAHVFNNRIYIYPSHDIETTIADNDNGDQYAMEDYHVFSLPLGVGPEVLAASRSDENENENENENGDEKEGKVKVTDHGVVLSLPSIPWASKQLWAPDAAYNATTNKYHLFFPARNASGRFQIGVAVGDAPEGPFVPEPLPIAGSYSIDPASFVDEDGSAYLYFGGIWGGQLQCYVDVEGGVDFDGSRYGMMEAQDGPALCARVARLSADMKSFSEPVRHIQLLSPPPTLSPIHSSDHSRRFFEAAWMHKRNGTYYFSYSTGDTHYLCYATGETPYGPFVYRGRLLDPVVGWTTHHSVVEFAGRWWLFHHDASLSGGKNHLRCVKVRELWYEEDGSLTTQDPNVKKTA